MTNYEIEEKEYVRTLKSLVADFVREHYMNIDISFYRKIHDWLHGRNDDPKPVEWSEEERIRKTLLRCCDDWEKGQFGCMAKEDVPAIRAYLEKQKEQKPAECIEFDNEFKNQVSHLLASVLSKEWEYSKGFVEYAAQHLLGYAKHEINHAEWSEEERRLLHIAENAVHHLALARVCGYTKKDYEKISSFFRTLCPQPKQEWSEEDEKMLTGIIERGSAQIPPSEPALRDEQMAWLMNRLKSLRPQLNAELTLLDKNIIDATVAFVEQNDHFNCYGGIDKHTVIKALRSLKPHWRPSDEQLRPLEYAIDYFKKKRNDTTYLESLYNDLKKL